MDWRNQITKPSLVVWPERVKNNIRRMKQKADRDGVRLRPHFKTHQSARVARWFREEGGEAITVSSVKMALYFASQGWENITIAFPVNIREMKDINDLAGRVQLNLLITSSTVAEFVSENLENPVGAWIKVDVGYGRTGIPVEEDGKIRELSRQIDSLPRLDFAGILTHAGQSYHISDRGQRAALYREVAERMGLLRKKILADGLERCLVSVGDTPSATAAESLAGVDELRAGNFVYFDAQQLHLGSCQEEDIAAAVVCPVTALHPERGEVLLYGGAIHLSKQAEPHPRIEGQAMHGYVVAALAEGWGRIDPANYLRSVSQEHGVARLERSVLEQLKVGDLVCVIPVHSCLAVDLLDMAITTDSELFALDFS